MYVTFVSNKVFFMSIQDLPKKNCAVTAYQQVQILQCRELLRQRKSDEVPRPSLKPEQPADGSRYAVEANLVLENKLKEVRKLGMIKVYDVQRSVRQRTRIASAAAYSAWWDQLRQRREAGSCFGSSHSRTHSRSGSTPVSCPPHHPSP